MKHEVLQVSGVTVTRSGRRILDSVTFSLKENEWLMVCGPNGAGKSTLIRALCQADVYEGRVLFDGKDVASLGSRERARDLGVFAQMHELGAAFTSEEMVGMGRYPYAGGPFSKGDPGGKQAIEAAMKKTGVYGLKDRSVLTLSGGEQQRVLLAEAFAQDPAVLLLDEPGNHLDLLYQKQIFDLIGAWVRQPGKSVLCVVHDLSLALHYADTVLLLSQGQTVAYGPPKEALSRENLSAVYQMDVYGYMKKLLSAWD